MRLCKDIARAVETNGIVLCQFPSAASGFGMKQQSPSRDRTRSIVNGALLNLGLTMKGMDNHIQEKTWISMRILLI